MESRISNITAILVLFGFSFETDGSLDINEPGDTNSYDKDDDSGYTNGHKYTRRKQLIFSENGCAVIGCRSTTFKHAAFLHM